VKARLLDRITIEPGKCGGRPSIRGLRMRVKDRGVADYPKRVAQGVAALM